MNLPQNFHLVCESEEIRIPGAIQPHGAFLALSGERTIRAASDSCARWLGLAPAELIGRDFGALFGDAAAADLAAAIARFRAAPARPAWFGMSDRGGGVSLDCRIHARDDLVYIDAEPWDPAADRSAASIHEALTGLSALRGCRDAQRVAAGIAALVSGLLGFDRVMVYRFDTDWNGEVIAESLGDRVPSYLGLNFPASDIPKQARDLYISAVVRHIPDAQYAPSRIVVESGMPPIDLSDSCLRSVSPAHLEYMHNMGVRASLVGSLLQNGNLWGLIACHHLAMPRVVSGPQRDLFQWICEDGAALIGQAEDHAVAVSEEGFAQRQARLLDAVHDHGLEGLLEGDHAADLLGVVNADGFAYVSEQEIRCIGLTPPPDRLNALKHAVELSSPPGSVFLSHALSADLGLDPVGNDVAGAVMLPTAGRHGIVLAWFRVERKRSVNWGGDPNRPVDMDDRGIVSPRKSFQRFLQVVEGESLRWRPEEIASAKRLKELIEIEVQRRLRARSDLLQTALTSLNEMVIVTEAEPIDPPGPRMVLVSEAVEQITGYTSAELIGRSPRIFQGPLTDRTTLDRLRAALQRWERVQVELVNYTKDGTPFWVELDIAPIADDTGWYTHWIAVQRDISVRKRNEAEIAAQSDALRALADKLTLAKEAAEDADRAKGMFLANMSHELRTPMHAIMSFSRLGLERADPGSLDKMRKYFLNIHESGKRLTHLLNDILDLSKLEAGRMELDRASCDLADLVEESAAEFEPLMSKRGLHFEFARPAASGYAMLDRMRIGQVLRNLLSNAIKFSHDGGTIRVSMAIARHAGGKDVDGTPVQSIRLMLEDEGIGIPEDELESVFDKFVQSSKTRSGAGGTGLGLAICREIVTAHGGTIRAFQREGGGTVFELILPGTPPAFDDAA